jgi:hypothetical protein
LTANGLVLRLVWFLPAVQPQQRFQGQLHNFVLGAKPVARSGAAMSLLSTTLVVCKAFAEASNNTKNTQAMRCGVWRTVAKRVWFLAAERLSLVL